MSEEDRIAAALTAFKSEPATADLGAFDIVDASLSDDIVTVSACTWAGDSVYGSLQHSAYAVGSSPNSDGEAAVELENVENPQGVAGQCLNGALADAALQTSRDWDDYWRSVAQDPATFDTGEAEKVMTRQAAISNTEIAGRWAAADVYGRSAPYDGRLPDSAVTAVLGRQFRMDGIAFLELLTCRAMQSDYGLYQGDVLVNDFKEAGLNGSHAMAQYRMQIENGTLKVVGVESWVWSECNNFPGGWLSTANRAVPGPTKWIEWPT